MHDRAGSNRGLPRLGSLKALSESFAFCPFCGKQLVMAGQRYCGGCGGDLVSLAAGGTDVASAASSAAVSMPSALNGASAHDATPASSTHTFTGSMASQRVRHTATLLRDNRVLIAGGGDGSKQVATAELFDPRLGVFSPACSMTRPRGAHTATLLVDGRVLVVGGYFHAGNAMDSEEVYVPQTGLFVPVAPTAEPRIGFTATLLQDNRVLIAGGMRGANELGARTVVELFDAKTGRFTTAGSLTHGRFAHTATLLTDGRVLLVGGQGGYLKGAPESDSELYDPRTGTFPATGPLRNGRFGHTATLMADGRVLVAGGSSSMTKQLDDAEIYDPRTGRFTRGAEFMANSRLGHTATLLPDGRVLISGGCGGSRSPQDQKLNGYEYLASADLFDPREERSWASFRPTEPMCSRRQNHTSTLLPDGQVLVAGGEDYDGALPTAEFFRP